MIETSSNSPEMLILIMEIFRRETLLTLLIRLITKQISIWGSKKYALSGWITAASLVTQSVIFYTPWFKKRSQCVSFFNSMVTAKKKEHANIDMIHLKTLRLAQRWQHPVWLKIVHTMIVVFVIRAQCAVSLNNTWCKWLQFNPKTKKYVLTTWQVFAQRDQHAPIFI